MKIIDESEAKKKKTKNKTKQRQQRTSGTEDIVKEWEQNDFVMWLS